MAGLLVNRKSTDAHQMYNSEYKRFERRVFTNEMDKRLTNNEGCNKQRVDSNNHKTDIFVSPPAQPRTLHGKSRLTSSKRKEEGRNGFTDQRSGEKMLPTTNEKKVSARKEILVSHRRDLSPRRSVSPVRKLAKDDSRGKPRERGDSKRRGKSDMQQQVFKPSQRPESAPIYPVMKDVKRRLRFDQEDDDNHFPDELGFTEKLAALRSLMGTHRCHSPDKQVRDGSDRKDCDGKSSHSRSSRVLVCKDRRSAGEMQVNGEAHQRREKQEDPRQDRGKRDLVSDGENHEDENGERLSLLSVDINALKAGLLQRKREKEKISPERCASVQPMDHRRQAQRDSGLRPHSSLGARLISNYDDRPHKHRTPKEHRKNVENVKKSENGKFGANHETDTKEIQTSYANHSHNRSIQSNVPFFEPASSLRIDVSAQKRSASPQKNFHGIADGVNIGEPGLRTNLSASVHDQRQTNVENFVGNLTPEKDKEKAKSKSRVKDVNSNVFEGEIVINEKCDTLKHESRNRRSRVKSSPVDENESISAKLRRINKLLVINSVEEFDEENHVPIVSKSIDKLDSSPLNKKRLTKAETKSETKVREWIENQQTVGAITPKDTRPLTLEELSVSTVRNESDEECSLRTDSCDKVPVKLEKVESVVHTHKPALSGIHGTFRGALLPRVSEEIPSRSRAQGRALQERERLELEFPVRDLTTSKAWRKVRDSVDSLPADSA